MTTPATGIVLYAEDDENDAFLMQHAFKRAGVSHRLVVARDGEEAVAHLEGSGNPVPTGASPVPSLVLLDLNMPRRSGFEVLAWIRAQPRFRELLVAILSSSNHQKDIDRAYSLGANSYFVKPSNVDERLELVRTIKEKWLLGAA